MEPVCANTLSVAAADGRNINVRVVGIGKNSLILVHGFGENNFAWGDISQDLATRYTVYAIDLRGHGDSDWDLEGRYELDKFTADLVCIIQRLAIARFAIVGHSLGAEVALEVTSILRTQVIKLILVEFSLEPISEEVREHSLLQFNAQFQHYNTLSEYNELLQRQRPLADVNALLCYSNNSLRPKAGGGFVMKCDPAVKAVNSGPSKASISRQRAAISNLCCPFLLIRGSGSAILKPAAAREIVELCPRAELQLVHGAGHAVMLDRPLEFYRVLTRFMLSHRGPQSMHKLHS